MARSPLALELGDGCSLADNLVAIGERLRLRVTDSLLCCQLCPQVGELALRVLGEGDEMHLLLGESLDLDLLQVLAPLELVPSRFLLGWNVQELA